MAIIRALNESIPRYAYLNILPDQFVSEKKKKSDIWIKTNMDHFANRAYAEYIKNRDTFVKNYDLVNGILRSEDFYETPEISSFTETLTKDLDLPAYVKMYSIITTPLNELVGEITKREIGIKVKAFDEDSKNEELSFKTKLLQDYILYQAREKIIEKLNLQGQEISDDELQQLTFQDVKDEIENYTSMAEKWGNHTLTACESEFNLKEKSEEAYRDMCISSREFFHVYEDNSKSGINIEVLNPKNTWYLTTPDRKYTSDVTGRSQGAYAAGTVNVMELSEIIEAFPDLTKEEIDHLRDSLKDYGLIDIKPSNLENTNVKPGINSIYYNTYDPVLLQERQILEAEMGDNTDTLGDFFGMSSTNSIFGYKFVVVRAYWVSKKQFGKLTYEDEFKNIQTVLVDEHYKSGTIPTQISLEWGYMNQWYQGYKIGPDIYNVKPFKLLPYCPIIGTIYNLKNTEPKSIIDMMKPFQVLYNICMNQLYDLLKKEIGNVARVSLRRVPRLKDGDSQDDIDMWEAEARERGIMFDDDSLENTKAPISNQTVAGHLDLTRTSEMQTRYNLAVQLKNECWELVGMSRQRLGSITASESATGTRTAISQSYSQTEPLSTAHEYTLLQLYQAILDGVQYVESNKPQSTLSYINTKGESAFIQINGSELRLRDLKVFPTNRPEDRRMFEEIRSLAQPLLQNGGTFQEVIELYSTNSVRQMKKVFRKLKQRQEEIQQIQMQQEQQKIEQTQQIAQAKLEQDERRYQEGTVNENYNKEMDRLNKKEVAIIQSLGYGKVEGEDINKNQVYDPLEMEKINQSKEKSVKEYNLKLAEISNRNKEHSEKMELEREKIKLARENQKNDLAIAKQNAKNRTKPKK